MDRETNTSPILSSDEQQDKIKTTSTGQQPADTHAELQDNTLQPESPEMEDPGVKQVDSINVQTQDTEENAKLAEVLVNSRHKLLIQILRLMKYNKSQRYLKIRHQEHHKMIIIKLP